MNKKILWFFTIVLVGAVAIAQAQQTTKVPRVGVFLPTSASATAHLVESFRKGLRDHGYIVGQNLSVEPRYAEGKPERLAGLAAELVRSGLDLKRSTWRWPAVVK